MPLMVLVIQLVAIGRGFDHACGNAVQRLQSMTLCWPACRTVAVAVESQPAHLTAHSLTSTGYIHCARVAISGRAAAVCTRKQQRMQCRAKQCPELLVSPSDCRLQIKCKLLRMGPTMCSETANWHVKSLNNLVSEYEHAHAILVSRAVVRASSCVKFGLRQQGGTLVRLITELSHYTCCGIRVV